MNNKDAFQISVNGQYDFAVNTADANALDVSPNGENALHVLHEGKAYRAELLETDPVTQTYTLRINGTKYTVQIANYLDQLVRQLGLTVHKSLKINAVKAPMPGLVHQVMVEPGQEVEKGQPLLILEAMKMENVIKAANDGVVKAVAVHQGMAVEKNQLLVEMD